MNFDRSAAKLTAKQRLREARPQPLLVTLAYWVLMILPSAILNVLVARLVAVNPMAGLLSILGMVALTLWTAALVFGYVTYILRLTRGQETSARDLFSRLLDWKRAFSTSFFTGLFAWLWGMLGVLPGMLLLVAAPFVGGDAMLALAIIVMTVGAAILGTRAALGYALAFFYLADDPGCGGREAIRRSKAVMAGRRWELFVLDLSFVGWVLLGCLTLGILYVWLIPYMQTTMTLYYEQVSGLTAAAGDAPETDQ